MGEAKRRRELKPSVIYHHTSTLRTNLLWMSGQIMVEGSTGPVLHPDLGPIDTDASLRRALIDFPPLVWFTREVSIPKCLLKANLIFVDKTTGQKRSDMEMPSRRTYQMQLRSTV